VSKKLIVDTNGKRTEIDYASLSTPEIVNRIRGYERKYGSSYARYMKTFSCDDARPGEMTDVMDWELLLEEKTLRLKAPPRKEEVR
jgi:hypothetical protein